VEALIYKTAPVLMEFEPENTISMLLAKPKLQLSSLLPALLRYTEILDKQSTQVDRASLDSRRIDVDSYGNVTNFAIKYLLSCVDRYREVLNNSNPSASVVTIEPSVYHTLIWLLCKYDDAEESVLLNLLQEQCDRQADGFELAPTGMDLDFILRQCRSHSRKRSAVLVYLLLGLHEQAVIEALPLDIALAKVGEITVVFS
jgi:hypothetical protein